MKTRLLVVLVVFSFSSGICVSPFSREVIFTRARVSLALLYLKYNGDYSRLPMTRTFQGNRKKVLVIGSSKEIAESKVKNSFYFTVNILVTFNCRNVK